MTGDLEQRSQMTVGGREEEAECTARMLDNGRNRTAEMVGQVGA